MGAVRLQRGAKAGFGIDHSTLAQTRHGIAKLSDLVGSLRTGAHETPDSPHEPAWTSS